MLNINLKSIIVKIFITSLMIFFLMDCNYIKDTNQNNTKITINNFDTMLNSNINKLVSTTNANDSWAYELCDSDSMRWSDIMSIELEELWLTEKPILFYGIINDIKSIDTEFYQIIIDMDWLGHFDVFIYPNIELRLITNKTKIDSFLNYNPHFFKTNPKEVAVIGKINRVDSEFYIDKEDTKNIINIGFGDLIDIVSMLNPIIK